MDLGARPGAGRPLAREDGADRVQRDGGGHERPRVDDPIGVGPDGGVQPGEADRTPTAVTSFRTSARVSILLGSPASPMYTSRPPGSTNSCASAGRRTALVASTTASNGRSGRVSSRQACGNPSERAKASEPSVAPIRCASAPAARTNSATSRPMVPGPSTSTRSPGPAPVACAARRALPPGSTSAPSTGSTESGRTCNETAGTASCSARAPARPPRMPTSSRFSHTCCRPRRQRRQTPQPSIVSPMTRRPTQPGSTPAPTARTRPAHSWPSRIG